MARYVGSKRGNIQLSFHMQVPECYCANQAPASAAEAVQIAGYITEENNLETVNCAVLAGRPDLFLLHSGLWHHFSASCTEASAHPAEHIFTQECPRQ